MNAPSRWTTALALLCVLAPVTASQQTQSTATTEPADTQPAPQPVEIDEKIAYIRIRGQILESPPEFSLFVDPSKTRTLSDWLQRLADARNDERVTAVAVEIDSPMMSWAQAQELADAIARLDAVKPAYTYLKSGGATSYLAASAGRDLAMQPGGTLMITGLAMELVYFRGTLDWLGIQPQMVQIGQYKGAEEPLTRTRPSEPVRSQYNRLLDGLYDQICSDIATRRGLEVAQVRDIIDTGPLSAESARDGKLVDVLVDRLAWDDHLRGLVSDDPEAVRWVANYGADKGPQPDLTNPFTLLKVLMQGPPRERITDPTIAIIAAEGMIVPGESGQGMLGQRFIGDRTMVETFEQVRSDSRIKGVVFRINSPGGSALSSELIYQAVRRCAARKPVVVSISDMGASGGYYIAAAADTILADAGSLVGSIGVVSGKLAVVDMLGKLGISTHVMTRGRNAGMWTSRPWDDEQVAAIRKLSRRTYDQFVDRVQQSRGEKIADIDQATRGRLFTGSQAVEVGLVDRVGGLREAVLAVQDQAGLNRARFITLPRPKSLMDVLHGDGAGVRSPAGSLLQADGAALPFAGRLTESAAAVYLLNVAAMLGERQPAMLTVVPHYVSIGD